MAEQPAVNRQVLGSNPSQGAFHSLADIWSYFYSVFSAQILSQSSDSANAKPLGSPS